MCGISGLWKPDCSPEALRNAVESMAQALAHRGPDGQGLWLDEAAGLGLGHTRLAIIDLSPAGHQPMVSADGRYTLVFNGEIYNFPELRRELEAEGHVPARGWTGHSDTEVLLAALAAWGVEAAIGKAVGMFALALWDSRDRTLTLVRDRLGKKPLYYGYVGHGLAFGSELKALRRAPGWEGRVDTQALGLYFRYLYVPAPWSIYQSVFKLEPGCLVRFTARDVARGTLPKTERYWSPAELARESGKSPHGSFEDSAEALDRLLREAVSQRLISDAPLGVLLSGGVDSATVTALMRETASGPVRTFSIGSTDKEFDESDKAAAIARHLGTEHTEFRVSARDGLDAIPLLSAMYDEPFADSSQIPTYLISRLARRDVAVCLTGDGGDEVFGGYNRYLSGPPLWRKVSWMGCFGRRMAALGLGLFGERALLGAYKTLSLLRPGRDRQYHAREKIQKVLAAMKAKGPEEFYHSLTTFWDPSSGLAPGCGDPVLPSLAVSLPQDLDFAHWMMAMDQMGYLPGDILAKVDRASMAVALETRMPLLDHRVLAFAWNLPLDFKIRPGRGKRILRQVLSRYVPEALTSGPKQGFGIPLAEWLRGPLRGWAEELLSEEAFRRHGLLNPKPARQAWREHLSGKRNRQYRLWAVLLFQAWAQTFSG